MMTTMAALLAASLRLAGGVGSELRRPLGIAIVGGLIISQAYPLYDACHLPLSRPLQAVGCEHPGNRRCGERWKRSCYQTDTEKV